MQPSSRRCSAAGPSRLSCRACRYRTMGRSQQARHALARAAHSTPAHATARTLCHPLHPKCLPMRGSARRTTTMLHMPCHRSHFKRHRCPRGATHAGTCTVRCQGHSCVLGAVLVMPPITPAGRTVGNSKSTHFVYRCVQKNAHPVSKMWQRPPPHAPPEVNVGVEG